MNEESNLAYYSKHGQDKYLNEEIFKNLKNGIFVDIGAYDGIESSNTYFFEKYLNWSGICVEPLPDIFSRLQTNRKCVCINKCISNKNEKAEFLHVIPANKAEIEECSKIPGKKRPSNYEKLSGLIKFYNLEHKKLIDNKLTEIGGKKEIIEVECISTNELFMFLPNSKIDYLSIDTEGSDFHILKSINLKVFDITIIEIEVLYPNKELPFFMKSNGYKLIKKIGYDWIYKKILI